MNNQAEYKMLHRQILKLTHPDNYYSVKESIPKCVEIYLSGLRNRADQAYENDDLITLRRIVAELNGETRTWFFYEKEENTSRTESSTSSWKKRQPEPDIDMAGFFRKMGAVVIDNRQKGGALWIVGSRQEIGHIVDRAIKQYHVKGFYSKGGRATKHRAAWWTTDNK